jgi:three-Cys-motif partner protein
MSNRERQHFEAFGEHTLLKHMILDKYLKAWARKILLWGGAGDQVWFVDAFAGEGSDRVGNPGSPVIASNIAKGVLVERGATATGEAPMRVLAIERNRNSFARLQTKLKPFIDHKPRIAAARKGTLHDYLADFIGHIDNAPALFFLDPCGVQGLNVDDLPTLMAGPHNEVFALFSDVGAHRLHATLATPERDREYEIQKILAAPSLFPDWDAEKIEEVEASVEASNEALRATREAAERILTEALRAEALPEVTEAPREERMAVLTKIFARRLQEAGALHVLSFPVRNRTNARVYQLVHGSKSKQGLRTMKESMSAALSLSDLPESARDAISFEVAIETSQVIEDVRQHFHGRTTVRWTQGKDRDVDTIKRYLLEETPVFPTQLTEIREALATAGHIVSRRPVVFSFPDS